MSPQDMIDSLIDYGYEDTADERKMEKINQALWDVTSREPWPFLEASVDLSFDGTSKAPTNLPTDLQSVLDIFIIENGRKLQPLRVQEADAMLAKLEDVTGEPPRFYYFLAGELRFAPVVPAGTGTVRLRYIRKHPELLQTDAETALLLPKEHHEVILLGALVRIADMEDDNDLSPRFQQLYEEGIQNMRTSIWMRQYDRPDFIEVVDDYDFYDYFV